MIVDEIMQISRDAAIVMDGLTNYRFIKILTTVKENYDAIVAPTEYSNGSIHLYQCDCGKYRVIYDVSDEMPRILVVDLK